MADRRVNSRWLGVMALVYDTVAAVAGVGCAAVCQAALPDAMQTRPLTMLYLMAALSAAVARGLRAAVISVALSVVLVALTSPPVGSVMLDQPAEALRIGIFVVTTAAVVAAIEALRISRRRAQAAREALAAQQAEVARLNTDLEQRVAELLKAQQDLRESESLYRAVGESIDFGVWVCDAQGRNIYTSPSLLKLVGLTADQANEFGWGRVLHPDDAAATIEAWKRCVATGGNWDREHRFRGVDGRYHPVLARGVPVRDESGAITFWAGINLDIGAFKHTQQELHTLNEELERRVLERTTEAQQRTRQLRLLAVELSQAEQQERRRLAQVLHDHLQQLLVAGRMKLGLARQRGGDTPRLLEQVDELLGQAIGSSRSLTLQLSPPILYDRGLSAAIDWLARRMSEEHGLAVRAECDDAADPTEQPLGGFLFEAVRELLFNIIKHAGAREATVTLVRDSDTGGRLEVADTGAGFDLAAVEAEGVNGDRFGLFSIRQRLELLGGAMSVDTAPGKGTRVTVTFPLTGANRPAAAGAAAPPPRLSARAAPGPNGDAVIRVLLADDHKIVREGLIGVLRCDERLEIVAEAADGQAAVDLTRELQPDIVVMDVSMPRLNGIEATRIISHEMPGMKVIGLSMHGEEDMAAAMREAGAVAYLTKGGPAEELIAAIHRCCEGERV